ncbi:hypothetical protein [Haladaptatus sp. DFWS20]|uniref:hypothetical protein n=1 Tax=Haladaptatus sp. DFWS20 TaxID=3403467 RepID=UPI003EB94ACA
MPSERRRTILAAVGSMFFTGCLSEIASKTNGREGLLEAVPYGEKPLNAITTAYDRVENPYYRKAVARACATNSSAHITIPPDDIEEAKST